MRWFSCGDWAADRYIEVINRVLRPGGVWINLGPLLYHWVADSEGNDDERYKQSIEVCVVVPAVYECVVTMHVVC